MRCSNSFFSANSVGTVHKKFLRKFCRLLDGLGGMPMMLGSSPKVGIWAMLEMKMSRESGL